MLCLTCFLFVVLQRQVVSLDEEADNPAFTENWKKLARVERRASVISYLGRPCIFTSHSTKIWKSKPVSDKLKPLYPHRRTSALQWKNQGETFLFRCAFFPHRVNSWQSIPHQNIPNYQMLDPSIYCSSFFILTVMLMLQLENCVILIAT